MESTTSVSDADSTSSRPAISRPKSSTTEGASVSVGGGVFVGERIAKGSAGFASVRVSAFWKAARR
jgi:hypothetical protein